MNLQEPTTSPLFFQASRWLRGAHRQTIWPLLIKGPLPPYRRQRWDTPDGDFIDLDWVDGAPGQPCVVLFHGLEGSSHSAYARALMHAMHTRGWHGVVVNFRGCSGEPNRLPRAYHSGDVVEIDWILRRLHALHWPALFAVGVSLGGNALLKWLAEHAPANEAASLLNAAATVSAPVDLAAAEGELARGVKRAYVRYFLRSLVPKALEKAARFPGLMDVVAIKRCRTLREFDESVTAPLHGFRDATDYYARASAKPLLGSINTPTLLLHAFDDPFLPFSAMPAVSDLPREVTPDFLAQGGHVGFVQGAWPGNMAWLPQRLLTYFDRHIVRDVRMP